MDPKQSFHTVCVTWAGGIHQVTECSVKMLQIACRPGFPVVADLPSTAPNSQNVCFYLPWTPNNVFLQFLLVPVETARSWLQSWWTRLSTGASREAPTVNPTVHPTVNPTVNPTMIPTVMLFEDAPNSL